MLKPSMVPAPGRCMIAAPNTLLKYVEKSHIGFRVSINS